MVNLYKRVYLGRTIFAILLILFLALPFKIYKTIAMFTGTQDAKQNQTITLDTAIQPSISSIFTTATNIPLKPMPMEICIQNNNKLFLDKVEKLPSEVFNTSSAGEMHLTFHYDGAADQILNAITGSTTCMRLSQVAKSATTTDIIQIDYVFPGSSPVVPPQITASGTLYTIKTAQSSHIDPSLSSIIEKVEFDWRIYFQNCLYIFIGFIIFGAAVNGIWPIFIKDRTQVNEYRSIKVSKKQKTSIILVLIFCFVALLITLNLTLYKSPDRPLPESLMSGCLNTAIQYAREQSPDQQEIWYLRDAKACADYVAYGYADEDLPHFERMMFLGTWAY